MPIALRWTLKAAAWVVSALLLLSGFWGIPPFISAQATFLSALGGETLVRTLAVVCGVALALIAIGPTRLREWKKSAYDWWNSDALLRAENERLRRDKERLEERLIAYEGRNAPKVVAKAENPGPVILDPQELGHHFGFNSQFEKRKQYHNDSPTEERVQRCYDWLIVPYKFNDGPDTSTAEPAATIEVADVDDIFIVAFSYEVLSPEELHQHWPGGRHQVWLEVTDVDKAPARWITASPEHGPGVSAAKEEDFGELFMSGFSGTVPEVPVTWGNIVSSSHHLHGLPGGVYGLRLVEEMARDYGPREYRNMRLTVRKL